MVVTSDHGESLGEHDYYFDHGEDLFDPSPAHPADRRACRARRAARAADALASTLDLVPTVLDAVKVSYPPDLAGTSLLPALRGQPLAGRDRLFARNDRNLTASFDARFKVVATPADDGPALRALRPRGRSRRDARRRRARGPTSCASGAASWSCSWSARTGSGPTRAGCWATSRAAAG